MLLAMGQRMLSRLTPIARCLPLTLLLALPASPVSADPGEAKRGPLTDATSIQIMISEKGTGDLGVLLPLPQQERGDGPSWSEAEVSRVRDGESGFCRVRVRRGYEDPAHDVELHIKCAHRKNRGFETDLRLETIHSFGRRKKAVIAEFSQPDGSSTKVTLTAK
jgi:hypothetical protein